LKNRHAGTFIDSHISAPTIGGASKSARAVEDQPDDVDVSVESVWGTVDGLADASSADFSSLLSASWRLFRLFCDCEIGSQGNHVLG
jgi:hypothetical protein